MRREKLLGASFLFFVAFAQQKPIAFFCNYVKLLTKGGGHMLFVADIGNTTITVGVFDGDVMVCSSRLSAVKSRSVDEYAVTLKAILEMYGVAVSKIRGAAVSSVVKPLNPVFGGAVERLTGVRPIFMGPGVRTGLDIKIDRPSELGADIAACCVGALSLQKPPFVVLGLGDATTLAPIDRSGRFNGMMICPGVRTGLEALSRAAELTAISLEPPRTLVGKNTVDSMNSGAIYGGAAMIEGLVARLRQQLGEKDLPVIATGSLCDVILPYCSLQVRQEPDLVLLGLKKVYELNTVKR